MRLFISHSNADLEVAESLQLRLGELPDTECVLMATDVAPGDDWETRIRRAAKECDAIACLVTPEYIRRPWFYAEWSAFWFQEKPWFLLLLDANLEDVFEVMRRRQSTVLDDRRSVERFLTALAPKGGARGLDLLAGETVKAVVDARKRAAAARSEADLATLAVLLRAGQDNVHDALIERLLASRQLARIIELARSPASDGPTKRRQLGVLLVKRGHSAEASLFDELIANNAERRTVGIACLDRLVIAKDDAPARDLLKKIYCAVHEPQKRDLRNHAEKLQLGIDWRCDG